MWSWSSLTAYAKRTAIVAQNLDLARIRQLQIVVVDEAGLADPDSQHRQAAWSRESGRVDHVGVLELGQRLFLDRLPQSRPQAAGVALAARVSFGGEPQGSAEASRRAALGRVQVSVARAQCQAVCLAHGRAQADLDPDVQVEGQAPDHSHLLRILLAEVGTVWSRGPEQLGHDRRHALEVARARGTFEGVGDAVHVDPRAGAGRVHVGDRRLVDGVDP